MMPSSFKKLAMFVFFVILLMGCQNTDHDFPDDHMTPQPPAEQEGDVAPFSTGTGAVPIDEILDNPPTQGDPGIPLLEGGSAKTERKQPVSNLLLQQKYPNILVLRGSKQDKKLALTFDDGPDRRYTPAVLEILKKHGVKGTFFLMGSRAAALPEITKKIHDEGHAIGNHTYWHPKLFDESLDRMHWEVTQTDNVLESIVGFKPKLFRAPYGGLNEELVEGLGEMDYSVIGWSVDSEDWKELSGEKVRENIMEQIHPGAIILMHSGGDWTQDLSGMLEGLNTIIPELQDQGYEFVTIPELLNINESRSVPRQHGA